jgi:hypothetical protein
MVFLVGIALISLNCNSNSTDPDETESGTLNFVNNTVTVDPPGEDPFIMAYQLTDTLVTLVDPNSTFDFDDDETDETATETIVMVRQ